MATPVTSGTVVSVDNGRVTVATRNGSIIIDRRVDATAYAVGDKVGISNGVVTGRRRTRTRQIRV
jgi:hypothetical protein